MDLRTLITFLFKTIPAHFNDHAPPTYKMNSAFKPFIVLCLFVYVSVLLHSLSSFILYWLTYGASEIVISDVSLPFLML